ncbi:AfsR/SARP family transcriptional regulator [Tamaricihabitans halophyticus]|nr:tetratricopeptide repeat protein [Tamaricihabitans halophyticus]
MAEPERLSFGPGGYRLTVLPGELDAEEFDTLVDDAISVSNQEPQRCAELLRKALAMFHGDPFQGIDLLMLTGEVQRYAERRLVALDELYAAELRSGRHAAVVGELTELANQHPLRERFHGLLMTALSRCGRQADALAAYRRAREISVVELGLEPGSELRAIEQRVLAGEDVPTDAQARHVTRSMVPAQLPAPPTSFVGRTDELGELDAMLSEALESVTVVAVVGAGGVGKTALARYWANGIRDQFPDGQLYLDLCGYGPDAPVRAEMALAGFLRAFGVEGSAIPQDVSERSALLRSALAGTRTLLVLDNAKTAEQVRPLLPATPGCLVLVTSRDPLASLVARDGANRILLSQFTWQEADSLLRNLLDAGRIDADPIGIDRLIARCARLPLALRIAAERIRFRPAAGVGELVDELEDPRDRLDLLETGDDPNSSVRTVLSWSYRQLPREAAELLRLWALHVGHDIDIEALAALTGRAHRDTRRSIELLQRAHLVDELSSGRFLLHDLLRAYAAELLSESDDAATRAEARRRLFDHYLSTSAQAMEWIAPEESELGTERYAAMAAGVRFSSYADARGWLDTERANLVQIAEHAPECGFTTYTFDLSATLWPFLDIGWHHDDAQRVHSRALDLARKIGDRVAEGIALRNLGLWQHRLNEYAKAAEHLEQALSVQQHLEEPKSLATTLNYLAGAYQTVGRFDEAITHFRHSTELYRELGSASLESKPLSNLGHLYRRLGRYAEAEHCLMRAMRLAEEADHLLSKAYTQTHLAFLRYDTAHYDEALNYARRMRDLIEGKGVRALDILGSYILGSIDRSRGNLQEAIANYQLALRAATPGYDTTITAMILNGLAEAHAANGDWDAAAENFEKALVTGSTGSGVGARYEQARAYSGSGDVCEALGQHSQARQYWRRAWKNFRDLQSPEAGRIAAKLPELEW